MKKKAIIVSGYFNPLHKGHLDYFNNAKALCDELFVIVNSDHQRELKGSKPFQDEKEQPLKLFDIFHLQSFCKKHEALYEQSQI